MSTLMSGDMNISRPSTRVRTAPGGASTITFGDPTSTTVKAAAIPAAPVASAAAVGKEIFNRLTLTPLAHASYPCLYYLSQMKSPIR